MSDRIATPSATRVRIPALLRIGVLLFVSVASIVAAEVAFRLLDGHRFDTLRLQPRHAPAGQYAGKFQDTDDVVHYISRLPLAPGVDVKWFSLQIPAPSRRPPDADLAERSRQYPDAQLPATYEWNRAYVRYALCNDQERKFTVFDKLRDAFVFDAPDLNRWPTFRYLRSASYPSGLQTNVFGWRAPDVTLDKPPDTIRIAFAGASTTVGGHGDPFAYPDLVAVWLNLWAAAHHRDVRFEVLNTAREGTNTSSIRAIIRDELMPLEPDIILFYEGSNHFWPGDFVQTALPPRPISHVVDSPGVWARHSALVARVRNLFLRGPVVGEEPEKPVLDVRWPPDLSETEPDIGDSRLPTNLVNVLADFDEMRKTVHDSGTRLVLTSFTWLVDDGMRLDPKRDAGIFRYLNEGFWPYSYAHMRRYADFQNRVYRRYAEHHGLDFIDYDAQYPRDPRLFYDAIHMTMAGIRVQAWIVFQGLVPLLEQRIASGEWPRADRVTLQSHPAFAATRQLVPIGELNSGCAGNSK
jgi:hypothetical protein